MRRLLLAGGAVLLIWSLGFLYIGTTHRDRCMKAGNVGCTILPWSGHPSRGETAIPGWGPFGGG